MATNTAQALREYETIFLVKSDLTDDGVDKIKDRVRGIVDRDGGKVIRFTVWGKKKTSYEVAKQNRAIYVHTHYLGDQKLVAELERNLRNLDEVTRFLSVKLEDEVDPESRPVQEDVKLAGDLEETPRVERETRTGAPESAAPATAPAAEPTAAAPAAAPAAEATAPAAESTTRPTEEA